MLELVPVSCYRIFFKEEEEEEEEEEKKKREKEEGRVMSKLAVMGGWM